MQSHQTYFCLECHLIGDIDQFEFKILALGCFLLICRSCEKKSAVFNCQSCSRNNFLQVEVIEQSKIFTCTCQMSYRVFFCVKCREMNMISKKGSLLQGETLSCYSCKQNQVKLNCPSCGVSEPLLQKPKPHENCSCPQCGCQYQYDECPDVQCLGEIFTLSNEKSICNLQKDHQYDPFICQNRDCQSKCYLKKDSETLFYCKSCNSAQLKINCLECHQMISVLHPNGCNSGFQKNQCSHCSQQQIYIQCPGCQIGIIQISSSWFAYVEKYRSINPTPFCPIRCISCNLERTFVMCKHCQNITLFEPNKQLDKCLKCQKVYEIKKQLEPSHVYCCTCYSEESTYALIPCGHICLCKTCLDKYNQNNIKKCPMCNKPFTQYLKIYTV